MAPVSPATKPPVDAEGVTLRQKLDCALQLARTVSLDFNNALTSILGHTSLLLGKTDPGHPWRHSLIEVEKSAARAAEIAGELQTFSRQEKETRRQPPGNLSAVVSRCVDFFRNAPVSKINWKVQAESDLFGARFDEAKVQQALTKILENAAEGWRPAEVMAEVVAVRVHHKAVCIRSNHEDEPSPKVIAAALAHFGAEDGAESLLLSRQQRWHGERVVVDGSSHSRAPLLPSQSSRTGRASGPRNSKPRTSTGLGTGMF